MSPHRYRSWPRLSHGWLAALAIVYGLLLFTLTHLPQAHMPRQQLIWDKLAHFGAYAGLTFLVGLCIRMRPGMTLAWAAGILAFAVAFGAFDELTQQFVPGRSPDLRDWTADVLGAATGLIAMEIFWRMAVKGRQSSTAASR